MEIKNNYPMSDLTTLRIGGNAKYFIPVYTEEELTEAINYAKKNNVAYLVIGSGSNLLVSDEDVDKLIIKNEIVGTKIATSATPPRNDEGILTVKSGTLLQDLVDYSIEHGLSGLQKLAGIPGTVGGAVYGNAGAYGQSISDHLISVAILNPSSVTASPKGVAISIKKDSHVAPLLGMTMTKAECGFAYRDSIFKKTKDLILEVTFNLENGDPEILKKESQEIKIQRNKKYPPGIKCPGSFFKNIIAENLPKEILEKIPTEKIVYGKVPAGTLLEMVGAKRDKLGDIEIAPYHANLFINTGGGTAKDFYSLAKRYVTLVKQRFGINLEPEVQLIDLPPI